MLLAQPASSHASREFCVVSVSERAMFELEHGGDAGVQSREHPVDHWLRRETSRLCPSQHP